MSVGFYHCPFALTPDFFSKLQASPFSHSPLKDTFSAWFHRRLLRFSACTVGVRSTAKMGMLFSSLFSKLFGEKQVRILILGLDNAGKTTILYKLYAPDRVVRTMPTVGFNVEQVTYKNLSFSLWDLGGQTNIRPYWRCYLSNTNAIIYVIDSADRDRIQLAKTELYGLFAEEEMKDVHLLVFANKQDQEGAMSEAEVAEELGLHTIKDRKWHIRKASAVKGEGLSEGLDWLADTIMNPGA